MSGTPNHGHPGPDWLMISVIIYILFPIACVALAYFVDGVFLSGICIEMGVVTLHGLLYVMFSKNTPVH